MGKLIFILTFFVITFSRSFASEDEAFSFYFQNDFESLREIIAKQTLNNQVLFSLLPPSTQFKTIMSDPNKKIPDEFKVTPYFWEATEFWFNIYTQHTSQTVVIHDRERLGIIYTIMDYHQLHESSINAHTRQALQNTFTANKVQEIRLALHQLSKGKKIDAAMKSFINEAIKKSPYQLPPDKIQQREFYQSLAENIRSQTGQKDHIKQGLVNITPYKNKINNLLNVFNLPQQLLALAFLESSFNTRARSRVGAAGVWQFMPFIGRHFMVIDDHRDDRLNPIISSVSAFFLLRENRQILRRWDLAIVAYNSGTRHIINARRQLELPNMTLEQYLTMYDHPHIGFASRNFYPSFLALVYALSYQDRFFNRETIHSRASALNVNAENLNAYVSICPINTNWFFNALEKSSPHIRQLNTHLLNANRTYPRGTIFISDVSLTAQRYRAVPIAEIPANHPKNWQRFVQNYNCSTR